MQDLRCIEQLNQNFSDHDCYEYRLRQGMSSFVRTMGPGAFWAKTMSSSTAFSTHRLPTG